MIFIKNNQKKIKVNNKSIESKVDKMLHALGYEGYDISIWLTTNTTIKKYNKQYRDKNKATDILSFPYHELTPGEKIVPKDPEDRNLGDIMISVEYAKADAPRWGHTFPERLDVLLAHGIAHLLGYDHETDEQYRVMHKIEQKLLKSSN